MLQTIRWESGRLELLDQTQLPQEARYVVIADERQMWDAIRRLVVRGAPAIGVAAAFGVYLGVRAAPAADARELLVRVSEVADYLATSRPTAVNLFWALDRMRAVAARAADEVRGLPAAQAVAQMRDRLLAECLAMLEEDNRVCRAIGEHGADLLAALGRPEPLGILTHCNAGGLATVQYGTALAPIYVGAQRGMRFHVWADETRPLLQGSRITAYELHANGIPVTVICDNMAATVMASGRIAAAIVGADRIAANGDVANKIGTLGVAILARHFGIPVFVAAPLSTIDWSLDKGAGIPIEQRDPREISPGLFGGRPTAPQGVEFFNPAFDVTPSALVSAIITERGIARPPLGPALAAWRPL